VCGVPGLAGPHTPHVHRGGGGGGGGRGGVGRGGGGGAGEKFFVWGGGGGWVGGGVGGGWGGGGGGGKYIIIIRLSRAPVARAQRGWCWERAVATWRPVLPVLPLPLGASSPG